VHAVEKNYGQQTLDALEPVERNLDEAHPSAPAVQVDCFRWDTLWKFDCDSVNGFCASPDIGHSGKDKGVPKMERCVPGCRSDGRRHTPSKRFGQPCTGGNMQQVSVGRLRNLVGYRTRLEICLHHTPGLAIEVGQSRR